MGLIRISGWTSTRGRGRAGGGETMPPPSPSLPEAQHVRAWPKLQPVGPPLFLLTFNFCFQRIIARGNCKGPVLARSRLRGPQCEEARTTLVHKPARTLTPVTAAHSEDTRWRAPSAGSHLVPPASGGLVGACSAGRERWGSRPRTQAAGQTLRGQRGPVVQAATVDKRTNKALARGVSSFFRRGERGVCGNGTPS